jgi:hypothetical protein
MPPCAFPVDMECHKLFAWNQHPSNLSLLNSWDYRRKPPAPGKFPDSYILVTNVDSFYVPCGQASGPRRDLCPGPG